MGHVVRRMALALALGGLMVTAAAPAAGAAPSPAYSASLTWDGSCLFTAKASWKNVQINHVYLLWYYDDAWVATTEAPFSGPNAGTIKGRTATFRFGPATVDGPHSWRVTAQFYAGSVAMGEVIVSNQTAPCAIG